MVTKAQMRTIVREMTGRHTSTQMSDVKIDSYINRAYTLHFPLEFKTLKLTKPYIFLTTPNVDTYNFVYQNGLTTLPNGDPVPGNIQINPPVYCQGYALRYYQNKSNFYACWPKLTVNQELQMGNNTSGPYTGVISSFPFLRAQVDILGNVVESSVVFSAIVNDPNSTNSGFTYTCSDVPQVGSNLGNLLDESDNVVGQVNYLTGEYSFTLANAAVLPDDCTLYVSVVPYQSSRPTDVLFYNQQLVLRPVPQQVFQMSFEISQQPLDLAGDGDSPELDEWYLLICAMAARLIYISYPDDVGLQAAQAVIDEQVLKAQRRTLRQKGSQRAQTLFTQPIRPYQGYYLGTQYSGN